ncbi:hypothetical protein cypCar_00024920 [Cyprinus carpio]|nr:hypothetical protein cypCar_00024920 [Cyprinus carpio]
MWCWCSAGGCSCCSWCDLLSPLEIQKCRHGEKQA